MKYTIFSIFFTFLPRGKNLMHCTRLISLANKSEGPFTTFIVQFYVQIDIKSIKKSVFLILVVNGLYLMYKFCRESRRFWHWADRHSPYHKLYFSIQKTIYSNIISILSPESYSKDKFLYYKKKQKYMFFCLWQLVIMPRLFPNYAWF